MPQYVYSAINADEGRLHMNGGFSSEFRPGSAEFKLDFASHQVLTRQYLKLVGSRLCYFGYETESITFILWKKHYNADRDDITPQLLADGVFVELSADFVKTLAKRTEKLAAVTAAKKALAEAQASLDTAVQELERA